MKTSFYLRSEFVVDMDKCEPLEDLKIQFFLKKCAGFCFVKKLVIDSLFSVFKLCKM